MKLIVRTVLAVVFFLSAAAPASACWLWPFGGWGGGWGAGYAPYYGAQGVGYSPGYPAYSAGYYSAGYYPSSGFYSAGYAGNACCVTNCCDPCGNGGCATGSCVGTTPSGTLKPATDPKFDKSDYDDQLERDRQRLRSSDPARTRDNLRDDGFDTDGMGDPESRPFDGIRNKPAMPELDDTGGSGTRDPEPFLENDPQVRLESSGVIAHTASLLNGKSQTRRLASRSMPASAPKATSFAGKTNEKAATPIQPVRWISVPAPEGQVRL